MITKLNSRITRAAQANTPHNCKPVLCVTLYPSKHADDSMIGLKELGRAKRTEQRIPIGDLYGWLLRNAAYKCVRLTKEYKKTMPLAKARKKARRECGL